MPTLALAIGGFLYWVRLLEEQAANPDPDFATDPMFNNLVLVWMGGYLLFQVQSLFTAGAISYGLSARLRGESPGIGACVLAALRRFWAIGLMAAFEIILTNIGTSLCVIPGLIVAVCWVLFWHLALPALVVEDLSLMDAFGRSQRLSAGYNGRILGIVMLLGLIRGAALIPALPFLAIHEIAFVVMLFFAAVFAALLPAVGMAVIYHDIRESKEGLDDSRLEDVFG